jgi:hypothetical protein
VHNKLESSQVPTAPNLGILTEIVTDTRTAPSTATAQMQAILGELDKAAAQSALIIGSAGHSPLAERRATSDAAPSWSPVSVALIVGIEFLSREAIWSEFNLPRDAIQFVARLIGPQIILRLGLIK